MNFLTESRIDYLTHRWNIHSGCNNFEHGLCQVGDACWARQEVEKFPERYKYDFEPHFWPEALHAALSLKKPARVGVAFQGDLFCDWTLPTSTINFDLKNGHDKVVTIKSTVRDATFSILHSLPYCRFLFLTKNWANLSRWEPFPDNAWVGGTATNQKALHSLVMSLPYVRCAHRWISIEPPYEKLTVTIADLFRIGWVVIGAQTKPLIKVPPEYIEWVVNHCIEINVPVFLKKNIWTSLPKREPFFHDGAFRQEYPQDLQISSIGDKK